MLTKLLRSTFPALVLFCFLPGASNAQCPTGNYYGELSPFDGVVQLNTDGYYRMYLTTWSIVQISTCWYNPDWTPYVEIRNMQGNQVLAASINPCSGEFGFTAWESCYYQIRIMEYNGGCNLRPGSGFFEFNVNEGFCFDFPGCPDPNACNYFPNTQCWQCCMYAGCTNPAACNFNPAAGCDNGSCLTNYGCTNPTALNYNATANCDNGSCQYAGCTYPSAVNYDPDAVDDDGSCIFEDVCPEDVDKNGSINVGDLLLVMGVFGNDCQ